MHVNGIILGFDEPLPLLADETTVYANHSCGPSLWWDGSPCLLARSDINVGNKVMIDYGASTDNSGPAMDCRCVTSVWRATIRGPHARAHRLAERYGGCQQKQQFLAERATVKPPHQRRCRRGRLLSSA